MAVAIRRLRERKARRKREAAGVPAEESGPAALRGLIETLPGADRRLSLTHASWVASRGESYGRLAFLGDSVLGLTVAEYLYARYPEADIGRLTKMHGQAVSGRACAEVTVELGLPEMMAGFAPESGKEGIDMKSLVASERVMSSICESVIGACYLHHGFQPTTAAVLAAFAGQIRMASEEVLDHKSALQEVLARSGTRVGYRVLRPVGPAHARRFEVVAEVDGETLGAGSGSSKKAAEQAAAAEALAALQAG